MLDGTKQMILMAIDNVKLDGGTIVIVNGEDHYRVTLNGAEVIIEKVS